MAIVKSVQQVSITIAAGATSGTATISAVTMASASEHYNGENVVHTSLNPATDSAGVALTSPTQLTATRDTSDASNAMTVEATVIDWAPSAVTSIQRGTITMTAASSNTASLTFTLTNANVQYNGLTTSYTSNNPNHYLGQVALTASTVTASRGGTSSNMTVYYCLIEMASGIINSGTQQAAVSFTGTTSGTATLTAITMAQTMTIFGGCKYTGGAATVPTVEMRLELTATTTITGTVSASGGGTFGGACGIFEFKSADLVSLNRGTISIASGSTSNTATISAVTTTLTIANFLGDDSNGTSLNRYDERKTKLVLTNSTTLTAAVNLSSAITINVTAWEAVEFVLYVDVPNGPWSDPVDVFPYRRKEERYLYPSVSAEALLNSNNFNTVFAQAWAEPVDVFPYRRPNNWWIRVAPVYQSNPGTIKILYADAWEVNNFVRFYPKPNYWWTNVKTVYEANPATIKIFYADAWVVNDYVRFYPRQNYWWTLLPEKYEANPANIGIFYAGAWEVNNQVRYYPAKNLTRQQAQSVMQPELATIGLIFSAAFTVQIPAPVRARLNLDFLAQNPVISFIEAYPFLGEYIVTLRRRRR